MRRTLGLKLLVLCATTLLCLLFGEIAVRLYLRDRMIYDIEMARYSTLVKMDSANPRIGHVHRPDSSARLMGVDVRINSDGLRDVEHPVARAGKERIAFLGDSLTFGWGVEQDQTFKSILERELNRTRPTEVINFGTGNYNTEQEVNLFLEKGLKYSPDKVVVFYFINDAEPTPRKSRLGFLAGSRLVSFFWSRMHAAFSNVARSGSFNAYYSALYEEGAPGWINARKAFLELKGVCAQRSIGLRVVLLPELHDLARYPFKKEHALVSAFLREDGIEHLDLAPSFASQGNPMRLWVSADDAHPNRLAHQMIAGYTLAFLRTWEVPPRAPQP